MTQPAPDGLRTDGLDPLRRDRRLVHRGHVRRRPDLRPRRRVRRLGRPARRRTCPRSPAPAGVDFGYANLAVRGRKLADVVGPQLEDALSLQPDLVSIVGGGNDILRPKADLDGLAARLEAAVARIRATGADVLMATPVDPADAPAASRRRGVAPRSTPPTSGASRAATAPTSSTSGVCTPCATGGCGPRTAST